MEFRESVYYVSTESRCNVIVGCYFTHVADRHTRIIYFYDVILQGMFSDLDIFSATVQTYKILFC
jgi:hypothetical protein